MWNRSDSEYPYLIPNLRGKACSFNSLDQIFVCETVIEECLATSLTSNPLDANGSPNHNVKNVSLVSPQSLLREAKLLLVENH